MEQCGPSSQRLLLFVSNLQCLAQRVCSLCLLVAVVLPPDGGRSSVVVTHSLLGGDARGKLREAEGRAPRQVAREAGGPQAARGRARAFSRGEPGSEQCPAPRP